MSRPFRFKRFEIRQDRTAMKVGTDGVLLGAWCTIPTIENGRVGNAKGANPEERITTHKGSILGKGDATSKSHSLDQDNTATQANTASKGGIVCEEGASRAGGGACGEGTIGKGYATFGWRGMGEENAAGDVKYAGGKGEIVVEAGAPNKGNIADERGASSECDTKGELDAAGKGSTQGESDIADNGDTEILTPLCRATQAAPLRILDVGAGTGLIALMAAQRADDSSGGAFDVDAIEIDANSYAEAAANVSRSPWSDHIVVHHCSLQDYARRRGFYESAQHFTQGLETSRNYPLRPTDDRILQVCAPTGDGIRYDLIVSNPPYFNDSLLCPDSSRTQARHTTELTYGELLQFSARLLSQRGLLSIILPADQADRFISLARHNNLFLCRRTDVLPTPGSAPKRSLMEFSRREPDREIETGSLVIESDGRHGYSEEYVDLTRDFYLRF